MSSPQHKVHGYVDQLDRELAKYPSLGNLEKSTGVPKTYAVIGIVAFYFILVVFNFGGQALTNFAGFIIPSYYSLDALFTTAKTDDTQWLTYWVVYGFLTVIESLLSVVYWFPFYYTFKFVFLLWLALPSFRGADLIFNSVLVPLLSRHFTHGPSTTSGLRGASTASNLRAKVDGALDKSL